MKTRKPAHAKVIATASFVALLLGASILAFTASAGNPTETPAAPAVSMA
jgi:hypothetical protein